MTDVQPPADAADAARERAAWLRLTMAPGIGPVAVRALLAEFGLPTALFEARPAQLAAHAGAHLSEAK